MRRSCRVSHAYLLYWLVALPTSALADDRPLLFTSFRGNGEDGLHLAASNDGLTWTPLRGDRPFLASKVGGGLMRDPCLVRGPDGAFHLVWTTAWNAHGIGYARSTDLVHWSEPRLLDVMRGEPEARNVWAPEIFHDAESGRWVILWSSTIPGRFPATESTGDDGYNHRVYATQTTDFERLEPAHLFFDPGHNVIDATLARDEANRRYLLFYKDETRNPPAKNLHVAASTALTGPYTKLSGPITGTYWAEGPTVLHRGGEWLVYFDRYTEHRYGVVRSKDLVRWTDESDQVTFPRDFRHGSVLEVDRPLLDRLRQEP